MLGVKSGSIGVSLVDKEVEGLWGGPYNDWVKLQLCYAAAGGAKMSLSSCKVGLKIARGLLIP